MGTSSAQIRVQPAALTADGFARFPTIVLANNLAEGLR
jgi:hypothetical protein